MDWDLKHIVALGLVVAFGVVSYSLVPLIDEANEKAVDCDGERAIGGSLARMCHAGQAGAGLIGVILLLAILLFFSLIIIFQ